MKILALILFGLCLGILIGHYKLEVCRNDLGWAVQRGVKAEAYLDLCRQGK